MKEKALTTGRQHARTGGWRAGIVAGIAFGGLALGSLVMGSLIVGTGPATAQNPNTNPASNPNYFPGGVFARPVPVPGQNVAPPAPRNNTAPAPPPITRPGETGATGPFRGGYAPPIYPGQNRAYPR